ncbi:SDR family oxidoreductase [Janibacter sp. GXQ6167]|uniref:SDR family oxidoreductase n=1 Tax=Janibacter sp. GXQ6167 TaxID=3240791 RepID=UPI0035242866
MARTYLITGAGSGIGKRTTELLREQGHTVVGVDLRGAEVEADLSTRQGRERGAREALDATGARVDAVIACAGLSAPSPTTVAVNYFGVVDFLEAIRPVLASAEAPRAVAVSSMATLHPNSSELVEAMLAGDEQRALTIADGLAGDPQTANQIYGSSKRALSRWIRRESITDMWAGAGIPLNAVAPGVVITPMTEELRASGDGMALVDASVPMPLNYHQSADSVANLLIWLASEANTSTCGQTIYCDGGAEAVLRGEDAWAWADERVLAYYMEHVAPLMQRDS